jgi:predicted transcriptional regulator
VKPPLSRFFARFVRGGGLILGELERRVLGSLWRREAPVSVKDLLPEFPAAAYTTVMTTLDRLYRKGLLERSKSGRAFVYRPRFSREEFEGLIAASALEEILGLGPGALRPALSFLVDAAGRRDERVLEELEALLRERRRAAGEKK